MKFILTTLLTGYASAQKDFVFIDSANQGPPGWRMVSRADLESNSDLKRRMVGEMDAWGIVRIADGGKLDGRGYGSKIHDTHGPECCAKTAWISYISTIVSPIEVVPFQRWTSIDFKFVSAGYPGETGWRMASREDLEQNSMLKRRVVEAMGTWWIVKISDGGKLDGSGYGSKIHDTRGPECCGKALWIKEGES